MTDTTAEIAAAAAVWVVEHGLDYGSAKERAAQRWARGGQGRPELPSHEEVEDAVREHLALFCADTQPRELRALREVALQWMTRLAEHRPYLAGAVWRGTATAQSVVQLELYTDDGKAVEIGLINAGERYEVGEAPAASGGARAGRPGGQQAHPLLGLMAQHPTLAGQRIGVQLQLMPQDALRGALKPDARGRSWRGDAQALQRLLAQEQAG